MGKETADVDNPGTEGNSSTPTDEGQKGQIDSLFAFNKGESVETQEDPIGPDIPSEEELEEVESVSEIEESPVEEGDRYGLGERKPSEETSEEEEVEEAPVSETPPAETSEIAALKTELAELKGMLTALAQGGGKTPAAQDSEPKPELPKIEVNPEDFLSEEEIDEFSVDPGKVLRAALTRVYQKAREDTLNDMPGVVDSATRRQAAITEARNTFWRENTDLLQKSQELPAVGRLIRTTANEVQSAHPEWSLPQVFEETGKQVRDALNLGEQAKEIEKKTNQKRPPNQPGKPRSKRRGGAPEDKRSGLQKQLDAMVSSVK